MHFCKKLFVFSLFLCQTVVYSALDYQVLFSGLSDEETLKQLQEGSQLVSLQNHPPSSLQTLKLRADRDLPSLLTILHAYGYYDAQIVPTFEEKGKKAFVHLNIQSGNRYLIKNFSIETLPLLEKKIPFPPLLEIGTPAILQNIFQSRFSILSELARNGYPLASIESQKILVNTFEKNVSVTVSVTLGPLASFGPTTMSGLKTISPLFIERKIAWKETEHYSPQKIDETQMRLLKTDLFSSVLISHGETTDEKNQLPIKIQVSESNHKSISIGARYASTQGFGATCGWTNRNFRGLGELLSLQGDFSRKYLTGIATYRKPDFFHLDQDYTLKLQALRERITTYLAFSYTLTNQLDRKINPNTHFSLGFQGEYLDILRSVQNGKYMLLAIPLFIEHSTADQLLNPTQGFTLRYYAVPSSDLLHSNSHFLKQRIVYELYAPQFNNKKIIFAWRFQVGSICGASLHHVPFTKLFFGGSDDDLRGYRYRTVSPLNKNHDPIGARSVIYGTFEPRFRLTQTLGFVPFFDIGTLAKSSIPSPNKKWFKSTGIGLRYFTIFGPLRFDIAFPLNKRRMDPIFRIYLSIGQTF